MSIFMSIIFVNRHTHIDVIHYLAASCVDFALQEIYLIRSPMMSCISANGITFPLTRIVCPTGSMVSTLPLVSQQHPIC